MSVDGFIAGPNDETDWMVRNWDNQLKEYVKKLTAPVDCIILGRKLAEGFIPYWSTNPDIEGADTINRLPKVVFTKTMKKSKWENTILATGNFIEEINKLKNQQGQEIIVYGGAEFVANLIKEKLIDEFHFLINPTLLGTGKTIFKDFSKSDLQLKKTVGFKCGISVLNFKLK